jgi:hypothetical protein
MPTIISKFIQEIKNENIEYNTNNFEGKINSRGTMILFKNDEKELA